MRKTPNALEGMEDQDRCVVMTHALMCMFDKDSVVGARRGATCALLELAELRMLDIVDDEAKIVGDKTESGNIEFWRQQIDEHASGKKPDHADMVYAFFTMFERDCEVGERLLAAMYLCQLAGIPLADGPGRNRDKLHKNERRQRHRR